MHLVTRVVKQYDMVDDELVESSSRTDANVTENVDVLVKQIGMGDHRVLGTRVFALSIADDGTPTVGAELT